jgi:EamA domain-containing membrane protein RarD
VKNAFFLVTVYGSRFTKRLTSVWDRKRQLIWLGVGLLFGTFSLYPLARDEAGRTDWQYFLQLETLLVVIICVMFYVYSRKSDK